MFSTLLLRSLSFDVSHDNDLIVRGWVDLPITDRPQRMLSLVTKGGHVVVRTKRGKDSLESIM